MKVMILNYKEEIKEKDYSIDLDNFEYDQQLNLTIQKNSKIPLVHYTEIINSTTTFSKANLEQTDKDSAMNPILSTMTKTDTQKEVTDPDPSRFNALLATSTYTEAKEVTDKDK